ncbi:heterokaryon incompatibility domain-containing protein [Trichoderma sp. SZMC 28014]
MPVVGEPSADDPSSDPTRKLRWSYAGSSDIPLPDEDPSQPFCPRHAITIGHLERASFGPYPYDTDSRIPHRDWHFGNLDYILSRKNWCRVCGLISKVVEEDPSNSTLERNNAEIIACWIWDGVLNSSDDKVATLRLRIAPEVIGWEDLFEPFDLVPLADPEKNDNLFLGRRISNDHFDLEIVKAWVQNCEQWHGSECIDTTTWKTSDFGVPFIRMISLDDYRLIETACPPSYAALSYVWGSAAVFKTIRDNIDMLLQPGGLPVSSFPKSIRDAMILAKELGFRYIWVDSLCIIQDSAEDKVKQLRMMDRIYSRASLTIVAAAGSHADAGIPGLQPETRSRKQHAAQISDDLILVALHPDTHRSAAATTWNTRGWTYQERLLSKRCLFSFPDESVSFQCSMAVWGEDYYAETPHLKRCAPMMDISLNRSWMAPGSVKERGVPTVHIANTSYLREYCRIVEEYTGRDMSYASDRLLGVSGVLDVLQREFGLSFIHGLPEAIIYMALLWQPRNKVKRVPKDPKSCLPLFPSWSWTGWTGPVGYEDWNAFNDMPEMEDRAKRVKPFAKLTLIGPKELEYFSPSTANSPSPGWTKVFTVEDGTCYVKGSDDDRYHPVPFVSSSFGKSGEFNMMLPPLGLSLRTRVARFRLTTLMQSSTFNQDDYPIERRGRFGLSLPSPNTSDRPWLGTILLPVQYHAKMAQDHEFIILLESYGFNHQEMAPAAAQKMKPFEVYDVMMIRRIEGEELARYRVQLTAQVTETLSSQLMHDSLDGKSVVERIGVGRMMKSAWNSGDNWEDFIIV